MADSRVTDTMREDAHRVLRADYWQDVRGLGDELIEEARTKYKDGETDLREWFIEQVEQSVDGHQRAIYTGLAIETVLYSDHDGAYVDDFGTDGLVEDGQINWHKLAWAALRADVLDYIEAHGLDVNADDLGLGKSEDEEEATT